MHLKTKVKISLYTHLFVNFIWVRKGKFVNTGNGDNQDNDRINCFMNRNSIQDWGIRKFVSDSTVGEINVKTMLNQFEYVMTNTPINETITSKILG